MPGEYNFFCTDGFLYILHENLRGEGKAEAGQVRKLGGNAFKLLKCTVIRGRWAECEGWYSNLLYLQIPPPCASIKRRAGGGDGETWLKFRINAVHNSAKPSLNDM